MDEVGTVVGLDLATTTGMAWHRPGMPRPFFEPWKLPSKPNEIGMTAAALEQNLRELYLLTKTERRISHFFFEAQHIQNAKGIANVTRLIGLAAIVEKFAYQVGARVYKVEIQTWRKHFLGKGTGMKTAVAKEMAIRRCQSLGWHTDSPDVADALGILDYSLTCIPNYPRPWRDNDLLGRNRLT